MRYDETVVLGKDDKRGRSVGGQIGRRRDGAETLGMIFGPPSDLAFDHGTEWEAVAETACILAVCSAPGRGGHAARCIGPDGITLTERGRGTNTRHINSIAMEAEDYADSLLVTTRTT